MSNKQIVLPLPLGGIDLGLLSMLGEGSKALTRGLPIKVSSHGLRCRSLHNSQLHAF